VAGGDPNPGRCAASLIVIPSITSFDPARHPVIPDYRCAAARGQLPAAPFAIPPAARVFAGNRPVVPYRAAVPYRAVMPMRAAVPSRAAVHAAGGSNGTCAATGRSRRPAARRTGRAHVRGGGQGAVTVAVDKVRARTTEGYDW
jgi:hypothetical protein